MQIKNPTQFRSNIRDQFSAKFGLSEKDATNLEKGVFNYTIQEATFKKITKKWEKPEFTDLYLDRLRTIYMNIQNPDLIQHLKNGEIQAQTIAFMTHQEMNPEHWKEMLNRKIKRDQSKFSTKIEASTDMFTCKKCRSKKCTYYELQTRSADEPATIFVTCLDCGKNWKS